MIASYISDNAGVEDLQRVQRADPTAMPCRMFEVKKKELFRISKDQNRFWKKNRALIHESFEMAEFRLSV